ncbi:MAG: helix-turn-helix transcriptional regulator [Actinomycetes bacterium]
MEIVGAQSSARTVVADRSGTPAGELHDSTRTRVARSLLTEGPATAAVLADRLGVTAAGVRRHLDSLVASGQVEARDRAPYGPAGHRGRGRPAKVYALTPEGREAFPQAYDRLAADAMHHLARIAGPAAVADFARVIARDIEHRYTPIVAAAPPEGRIQALADALSADGYAASIEPSPGGDQLCQHHCPVAHVAAEFPQLCEAETEAFARLLGRHVQRLSTIGSGGHVCTTAVPRPVSADRTERTTA